jgi:curli biogenesis system outer membrane secretion channel CsgG
MRKLGLISIVLMLVVLFGCTRAQVKKAVVESAKKYSTELGYEFIGASSTGEDSDGDSYVSVDVRVRSSSGQEEILALQCSYSFVGFETGCKRRNVINVQ